MFDPKLDALIPRLNANAVSETLYRSTNVSNQDKLILLANLLEEFPGMARHLLGQWSDEHGNLGLDFGALNDQVRWMARRLRDKASRL